MKSILTYWWWVILLLLATNAYSSELVLFYHTDPAGTPLAMTDSSGNVVWCGDYKPFGEELEITPEPENKLKFVAKEKDKETGLYYFGARYMEPKIGRFISPDPVGAVDPHTGKINQKNILNPQRLNYYAYGLNNPNKYIDPDGSEDWNILEMPPFSDRFKNWPNPGDFSNKDPFRLLPRVDDISEKLGRG